jgi:hypothetical protein
MTTSNISLKFFGPTVEFQIEDQVVYINPFERNEDRKPENGDIILSFIRDGVTDLHMKIDLSCQMSGLKCYGKPTTNYLVCDTLQRHWKDLDLRAPANEGIPSKDKIRPIDGNIIEFDDHMIATDLLRHEEVAHGVSLTIDDTEFHYFYVDPKYVDDFLNHTSSCAILVIDNWNTKKALIRKIVLADQSDRFYFVCDSMGKKDLKEFQAMLPKALNDKIVYKKSKWNYS